MARVHELALELGFEKMSLKDETLRCFFINRPDSPYYESDTFQGIISYLQTETRQAHLKQTNRLFLLVATEIRGMEGLHRFLSSMVQWIKKKEAKN